MAMHFGLRRIRVLRSALFLFVARAFDGSPKNCDAGDGGQSAGDFFVTGAGWLCGEDRDCNGHGSYGGDELAMHGQLLIWSVRSGVLYVTGLIQRWGRVHQTGNNRLMLSNISQDKSLWLLNIIQIPRILPT
ncbi:MAG: hypothetical protein ABJQ08_00490 [Paracoccaceae bacterium]